MRSCFTQGYVTTLPKASTTKTLPIIPFPPVSRITPPSIPSASSTPSAAGTSNSSAFLFELVYQIIFTVGSFARSFFICFVIAAVRLPETRTSMAIRLRTISIHYMKLGAPPNSFDIVFWWTWQDKDTLFSCSHGWVVDSSLPSGSPDGRIDPTVWYNVLHQCTWDMRVIQSFAASLRIIFNQMEGCITPVVVSRWEERYWGDMKRRVEVAWHSESEMLIKFWRNDLSSSPQNSPQWYSGMPLSTHKAFLT